jgi:hypothetical protein
VWQHPWSVCDHHVRRDGEADVQERADMASRSVPGLREHSDRAVREQGGREEQAGEGEAGDVPQEEEPPVLRDLCQVELQLREAIPLPGEEAGWVSNAFTSPPLLMALWMWHMSLHLGWGL